MGTRPIRLLAQAGVPQTVEQLGDVLREKRYHRLAWVEQPLAENAEPLDKKLLLLYTREQAHFPIALESALCPKERREDEGKPKGNANRKVLLLGKEPGGFTPREREVAQLYAQTIGLTEIDVFDSINAMGGDSIVSMEILKALNQRYGNHLSAADMFTYATVSDIILCFNKKSTDMSLRGAERRGNLINETACMRLPQPQAASQ